MDADELTETDVSNLPEPNRRYPVVVEETRRYVLWVDADNPDDAVRYFNDDPHDPCPDQMFSFDWQATKPEGYDWDDFAGVASHGGWLGMHADAHVEVWRRAKEQERWAAVKSACASAGHPVASGHTSWPDHCMTCGPIDPSARTAVSS